MRIIYVFGISFNKVDIPYLNKVLASNDYPEDIKWNVSYYGYEEADKFQKALSEIGEYSNKKMIFRHLTL